MTDDHASNGRSTVQQLQRALGQVESRYAMLVDNTQDGVYMVDREGRFTFVNEFIARSSGFPGDFFMGKNFLDFVRPEDRDQVRRNFEAVLGGEKVPAYELAYLTASGEPMWVEVNTAPIVEDGGVVGVFGISRNIQRRKAMERALRESEAKYRTLVEDLPYGVVIVQDDRVVFANRAISGMIDSDPLGMPVKEEGLKFVAPSEREHLKDTLEKRLKGDEPVPDKHLSLLRRPTGEEFPVEIHAKTIQFQGRPAAQYVLVDVSHRQELEERMRQADKMEAIGTLAGGIAHDFNNLLTGILGMASLLKNTAKPDGEVHQSAAVIERAAQRAVSLTRQLLGFARRGQFTRQPVEVHQVIGDVFDILGRTLEKRIDLLLDTEAVRSFVRGDPNQLHQVFMNLAVNARDAMPDGGTLTVKTRNVRLANGALTESLKITPGRYLEVSVADTGEGITSDILDRIFDPFFTTKPPGEGSGMGLAVAYGIVRNHGGAIQAHSRSERGATFMVYLPTISQSSQEIETTGSKAVKGKGTILLVDDEEVVCVTVKKMLTALGYDVVAEQDPVSAVDYFREHKNEVDLVILDLIMPKMDGRQCFEELRKLDPEVRVLLSTGHGKNGVAGELLDEGMVGFMQKPYLLDQLSEAVARALA